MTALRRTLATTAAALGLAILTLGLAAALGRAPGGEQRSVAPAQASPRTGATAPLTLTAASAASLPALIAALQQHLREQPKDAQSWATLGLVYVEQARLSADPTYYSKAAGAFETSLDRDPVDNDAALAGLGALAAGRHDFDLAYGYASQAIGINPDSALAYGVVSDAHTELGRYDDGLAAAQRMDELRPGLPSTSRLAYHAELRGDVDAARALLTGELDHVQSSGDVAYVNGLLGDLAWATGDLDRADSHYATALTTEPGYVPAMFGTARVLAARGDLDSAADLGEAVVARQPTIEHLVWQGELLDAAGRRDEAREQYALVRAAAELQHVSGVAVDLEVALFEADHGSAEAALAAAKVPLDERPSIYAADAYAWALHVAGKDETALAYAENAARLGTPNALFAFHKGMIERSLGMTEAADADLARALDLNPTFSLLHAPRLAGSQ